MSDTDKLIASLHPLERQVLPKVANNPSVEALMTATGLQEIQVMRALQWLSNKEVLTLETVEKDVIELDQNGVAYAKQGLPEMRFLRALTDGTLSIQDLMSKAQLEKDEVNICIGTLKKKAAVDVKKDKGLSFTITDAGKDLVAKDSLEEQFLQKTFPLDKSELTPPEMFALENLLKRRKIVKVDTLKLRSAELTDIGKVVAQAALDAGDVIDSITPDMLKNGTWKGKQFRRYDVQINVPKVSRGRRHFVNQAIEYIKRIWLDMGFVEMQGTMLHTSFWDLDSLFVPQDHPARAMQDTFYIANPKSGSLPQELAQKIKATHENGWTTGSTGWGGKWSEEMAQQNMMRTHTTVLSAETIAHLKKEDLPAKFFTVGKVFRNEALDWKHLFEFHQVEGIVVDPDANFSHLKGYLRKFYTKMGYKDVRMRPAHFPYTEPSVEVDVLHPTKNVWIELGGAGIFRPEVVKPLLGFDCPVLAWGQGMERIIVEYFKLTDLRDLYKNDLKQIKEMKEWMRS